MEFNADTYGDIQVVNVYLKRATLKDAMSFRDFIMDLVKKGNLKFIVDLSTCEYIDSTFLGALVSSLKKIASIRGDLQLVYNNKNSTIVFEMTSMNRVFKIHQTLEDALDSLGGNIKKFGSA